MKEIKKVARAKINLGLDVVGKRENGYHDVRMIMQTINLYDKLQLKKIKVDKVVMETNLVFLPTDDRNLVVKVVKYFRETYGITTGVFIDLYKVIPVGAGLAGGSTDAAQAILGMNELFDLKLTMDTMLNIGIKFGADIPYCILGGTMLAEGIGEDLTVQDDLMQLNLIVAKPRISVSTAYVYENLRLEDIVVHPDIDGMIKAIQTNDLNGIVEKLGNVLEDVTIKGYPEIKAIKEALIKEGALGALMSGSGSAVFGIYENQRAVSLARKALMKNPLIKYVYETTTYNRKRGVR